MEKEMNPSITKNTSGEEYHVMASSNSHSDNDIDVCVTLIPSEDSTSVPIIIIDPSSSHHTLTVTPAFPNFPTDEEVVIEPESIKSLESSRSTSVQDIHSTLSPTYISPSSHDTPHLLEELKYLLKPTNSLATQESVVEASQEVDSAIKLRTTQFDRNAPYNAENLLLQGLTRKELQSLDAAERLSAVRTPRSPKTSECLDQSRNYPPQCYTQNHSQSHISPIIMIAQPGHRTVAEHLASLFWSFIAAYVFSIILFLTKFFDIDLIFGFFLQMFVQTIAFGIYAFYKGYNLLGPNGHRIAMLTRAMLISIGALSSFLAYYYIMLPELSSIRQTQVILTMILSIFFLNERITTSRIIACVLAIIAIIVLIRPITFDTTSPLALNSSEWKISWISHTSSFSFVCGISLALCTAVTYSIASIMNKIYFSTQPLHNAVLCFWSAMSALIVSIILMSVRHFVLKNNQAFPNNWRLFVVASALALASIFIFIANQKAIKCERSSIVTFIYSTDILLALVLQNIFTHFKSDVVVILGSILILVAILIICIEVFLMEKRQEDTAIQVAQTANMAEKDDTMEVSSVLKKTQKTETI